MIKTLEQFNFLLDVAKKNRRGRNPESNIEGCKKILFGGAEDMTSLQKQSPNKTIKGLEDIHTKLVDWPSTASGKVNNIASNQVSENAKLATIGFLDGTYDNASEAARKCGCNTYSVCALSDRVKSFDRFAIEYNKLLQ